MIRGNLLFDSSQGLPTVSVYSDMEADEQQKEQTSLRAGRRITAVGWGDAWKS